MNESQMMCNKERIGLIPARGGSQRLPGKNLLPLAGKPMIGWTIEAALQSAAFDDVIVSTDDPEIARVAEKFGARIPFLRPKSLATDTAGTIEVVEHALQQMEHTQGSTYREVMLLQPTSPLRNSTDIRGAVELFQRRNADAVISVCETEHSPLWSNTLPEDGDMHDFIDRHLLEVRSQDLPKYYRLNGAIYLCRTDRLKQERHFLLKENIFAYRMERRYSVDIDEKMDFMIAETLMWEQLRGENL